MGNCLVSKSTLIVDGKIMDTAFDLSGFDETDDTSYVLPSGCDISFSLDWDCQSDGSVSGFFEEMGDLNIRVVVIPKRWFFPAEILVRDAIFGWDEYIETGEVEVDVYSKNDAELIFGSRLARPVFWLWRQWRRLMGYLWKE